MSVLIFLSVFISSYWFWFDYFQIGRKRRPGPVSICDFTEVSVILRNLDFKKLLFFETYSNGKIAISVSRIGLSESFKIQKPEANEYSSNESSESNLSWIS